MRPRCDFRSEDSSNAIGDLAWFTIRSCECFRKRPSARVPPITGFHTGDVGEFNLSCVQATPLALDKLPRPLTRNLRGGWPCKTGPYCAVASSCIVPFTLGVAMPDCCCASGTDILDRFTVGPGLGLKRTPPLATPVNESITRPPMGVDGRTTGQTWERLVPVSVWSPGPRGRAHADVVLRNPS